jgi:hypothetical protein
MLTALNWVCIVALPQTCSEKNHFLKAILKLVVFKWFVRYRKHVDADIHKSLKLSLEIILLDSTCHRQMAKITKNFFSSWKQLISLQKWNRDEEDHSEEV